MRSITFSLCAFVLVVLGSRRDLQSAPWGYDVEQLSGSCEQADMTFHKLWNDASNLCSETINRMTPPSICKQQNSEPCPPGVETDCPDADPFNKLCAVNFETCSRSLSSQFFKTILKLLGPIGELGDLGYYALKGASAGVTAGIFASDLDAQINYGKAVEENKLAFRKLFHDYPDMLMELVEYRFAQSDQREKMSEDWSKISARTQKTILAHACRWEADKALRYVNFDILMEDLKSQSAFHDVWSNTLNNQASCPFGTGDAVNLSLDCLNKASTLIGFFDPTGISTLVGIATEHDFCPDINDRNDPHYNPRKKLDKDHPWHLVKERFAESLRVSEVRNEFRVENSRGDGESMSHQLRRKMLSQACPTQYQFSKGVCRPVSINQHINWGKTLVHFHDTRPQLIFVDEGSESHDQCCDKEGTTAIRSERDCRRAAQEVRPWARYIGTVNRDTIPYGCYADIRTENVGFNTNRSNKRLEGFYEPICTAGENQYKIPEFNVVKVGERFGYVMGAVGESCPEAQAIVRSSDCKVAIRDLALKVAVRDFEGFTRERARSARVRSIIGGCSLLQDYKNSVIGFYNDKHPRETNIPDNDPASYCDWQCYLDRYGDLRRKYGPNNLKEAASHYERTGRGEGRDCTCNKCDWQCYLDRYGDLRRKYGPNNLKEAASHYERTGRGEGRDCTCGGRTVPTPKGGSFPICYAKGVRSSRIQPIQERRIQFSERYAFNPPDCPRGYTPSGGHKSCSSFLCPGCSCLECFQPFWTCGGNPDGILVEGRRVPSNDRLPVAYCLDSKALGHK